MPASTVLKFPARLELPPRGDARYRVEASSHAPIRPNLQNQICSDMINTLREAIQGHEAGNNQRGINYRIRFAPQRARGKDYLIILLEMDTIDANDALVWWSTHHEPKTFWPNVERAIRLTIEALRKDELDVAYHVRDSTGLTKSRG